MCIRKCSWQLQTYIKQSNLSKSHGGKRIRPFEWRLTRGEGLGTCVWRNIDCARSDSLIQETFAKSFSSLTGEGSLGVSTNGDGSDQATPSVVPSIPGNTDQGLGFWVTEGSRSSDWERQLQTFPCQIKLVSVALAETEKEVKPL